jgi:hypothetical protein
MGPVVIFDKSFLHSLNPDEAAVFSRFFLVNLTPVFFIETLADLRKETPGRSPEIEVAGLAYKTSAMDLYPNVHHRALCEHELVGNASVPLEHFQIVVGGGRNVADGSQRGTIFSEFEEETALKRWQAQEFDDLERFQAQAWRDALGKIDLQAEAARWSALGLNSLPKGASLAQIKGHVDSIVNAEGLGELVLGLALVELRIPHEMWSMALRHWRQSECRSFAKFAPYASHVLTVDLVFNLAVALNSVSQHKATNRIDLAYLYYLPFCMVFVSNDKVHRRLAPSFLRRPQEFVWGNDLKDDLRRLCERYSALPEEVQAAGLLSFARFPPDDQSFLTTRLWDAFLPTWRDLVGKPPPPSDPGLLERLKRLRDAAPAETAHDDSDFLMFSRRVPVQVGKWRMIRER